MPYASGDEPLREFLDSISGDCHSEFVAVDELEQLLVELEMLVADGDRQIHRQREIIEGLASAGLDTTEAERMLRVFEKLQVLHVDRRDRVRTSVNDELGSADSA